jgi:formamidopyrimidine-DNA glycosylase
MPELAEVEYFRQQWDRGLGHRVLAVRWHAGKRIFRGLDSTAFDHFVAGSTLTASEARGKQLAFRWSSGAWLGVHLGMTGKLWEAPAEFRPARHDHLVLYQKAGALVFTDPRLFGRVLLHPGPETPDWWAGLPEPLTSRAFTPEKLRQFLRRHARAPLKAILLRQDGFPGIGNWMADEILWRARLHPNARTGALGASQASRLWRVIRQVCRGALKHVAPAFGDPPKGWLFNERWGTDGRCPRDGHRLNRATVGGRTTAWCPRCQRSP